MNIRAAIPLDASAIAHVHVASWRATYAGIVSQPCLDALDETEYTARWNGWLALPGIFTFIAETDGAIVGFASGGPIRKPIHTADAELYAIYLLPEIQRCGIGQQLVAHIETVLREQGMQEILVWVLRDNPATSFYRRIGGRVVAEDSIEIGGIPLQELAFVWPLSSGAATGVIA